MELLGNRAFYRRLALTVSASSIGAVWALYALVDLIWRRRGDAFASTTLTLAAAAVAVFALLVYATFLWLDGDLPTGRAQEPGDDDPLTPRP